MIDGKGNGSAPPEPECSLVPCDPCQLEATVSRLHSISIAERNHLEALRSDVREGHERTQELIGRMGSQVGDLAERVFEMSQILSKLVDA